MKTWKETPDTDRLDIELKNATVLFTFDRTKTAKRSLQHPHAPHYAMTVFVKKIGEIYSDIVRECGAKPSWIKPVDGGYLLHLRASNAPFLYAYNGADDTLTRLKTLDIGDVCDIRLFAIGYTFQSTQGVTSRIESVRVVGQCDTTIHQYMENIGIFNFVKF